MAATQPAQAVDRRRTKNDAGEWTDAEPTAHTCKLWGQEGENLVDSVSKGHRIVVVATSRPKPGPVRGPSSAWPC